MSVIRTSYEIGETAQLRGEGYIQSIHNNAIEKLSKAIREALVKGATVWGWETTRRTVEYNPLATIVEIKVQVSKDLSIDPKNLRQQQTIRKLFEALKERLKDDVVSVKTLDAIQEELEK